MNFLKILATFFALLISIVCNSQNVDLDWATNIGGTEFDGSFSIAVDSKGNIYTTGCFEGTVDFDPGKTAFNLTSNGGTDIFISKLDLNGHFMWAKQIGGVLNKDLGKSIAVDASGNVYITGYFGGTVDFDPGSGIFNQTAASENDLFICKLNESGFFVWAKQIDTRDIDGLEIFKYNVTGPSISLDKYANIYITGRFLGIVDFDPGNGSFILKAEFDDLFITKLDALGNFNWAKQMKCTNNTKSPSGRANSIAIDDFGNIYTTGYFTGTFDFDPGNGISELTATGTYLDMFVSKLNSDGDFQWVKQIGGTTWASGHSIKVDRSGNIYTTGLITGSVDFDPGPNSFLINSAYEDIFISKLNSAGDFLWTKSMGGKSSNNSGNSIAIDAVGNVFTTGVINNSMYIHKLDAFGNTIWTKSITEKSNPAQIISWSIAIDASNNVYTTGHFYGNIDFDPGINTKFLKTNGNQDIFIQKFTPLTVATEEESYNSHIKVYPNPFEDAFNIDLGKKLNETSIQIFDLYGKLVTTVTANNTQIIKIKMEESNGLYFLRIHSDDLHEVMRVVKK